MKRRNVLTAAILIVLANVWALVSVALNRADAPGGTLELTERELRLVRVADESTVLFLEIEWDTIREGSRGRRGAAWLDANKMAELGFPPQPAQPTREGREAGYRHRVASRHVVLEFEGEAWKQAPHDRRRTTRLFAVDAGRDPRRLRERYPDAKRYVITRALIRSFFQKRSFPEDEPLARPRLRGSITGLLPARVYLPYEQGKVLSASVEPDRTVNSPQSKGARFKATVSWGADYEPWLGDLRIADPDAEPTEGRAPISGFRY